MTMPTKLAKITTMAECPKCGCPDVHADSSSAAEASWIDCEGCDYHFQKRCDEETLIEKWNALNRKKMPTYDDGTGGQADA